MKLDGALQPPSALGAGRRVFLVGYLPTYAALLFLLTLAWAGARAWRPPVRGGLHFTDAWETAAQLGVGEVLAIALAVTLIAVVSQPLQLAMVRLLEGDWPSRRATEWARNRQIARRRPLVDAAELPAPGAAPPTDAEVQAAGHAGAELRRRYPLPDHLVRATALGNALTAAEDTAGSWYGLDAVVAWPRLYPVLGDAVRAVVDDQRDRLDAAARMAVTMAVTTVATVVLLIRTEWWLLLALVPAVLAVAAYHGAVHMARAYGQSIHVAFDLHRFDMLQALGVPRQASVAAERTWNRRLCDLWRQGVPLPDDFRYTGADPTGGQP
ncbi:hypothetical protein [Yinghuangia seranimata]|uniref:hypothetical protein n=1 Tax=Yinghuangia seranimata TaxID=408067 RepID=UPI00248C9B14|nr:hypothetical protein [Yinghuangia seranimata]MDI2132797.1 hypothetical protein [Yinghuangia seranimata]